MEEFPVQSAYNISFDDTQVAFASQSDKALKKKYLVFSAVNSNVLTKVGTAFLKLSFSLGLPVKGLVKNTIFEQFCGGETIEDSEETIKELAAFNIGTILDYSVEGENTEDVFDATTEEILRTVAKAKTTPSIPFCVFKATGLAPFSLLEKISKGGELTEAEEQSWQRVQKRVDRICKATYDAGLRVFIDSEETWIQEAIDILTYEMMKKYNGERAVVYNTFQMYRRDGVKLLKRAFQLAATHNIWLGAKLVRGAYMEKERERAEKMGYQDPIQPTKEATDNEYNEGLKFCLNNKQRIALCSGSHNEYSNFYLTVLMDKHGLANDDSRIHFAQLYGMSDNLSFSLAKHGYNVVKYVPYGPIKYVMPYLFRRAQENTAIAGQSSRELKLIRKEMKRRNLSLI